MVSITNPNAAPLSITGISLNNKNFTATQTQGCVGNLAPHASCQFYVAANPPAHKARKNSIHAKLEIQDDASGNPHLVKLAAVLHGSVVSPPPPPPPATLANEILVTNPPCNNVTDYAVGVSGNAVPQFPQPLLCTPTGVALDASKNVWVTNSGDDGNPSYSIAEYPAAAISEGGNIQSAPSAVIAGSATLLDIPRGIAFDTNGNIYVVNDGSNNGDADSVTVYASGSTGNVAPSLVITGPNTGLNLPLGIAVDSAGKIYVANNDNNTVTVYAAGLSGTVNATPIQTIRGFSTGLAEPTGVALDSNLNIYVSNQGSGFLAGSGGSGGSTGGASVTVYPAGSTGNATPTAIISGANTGLGSPVGIALDGSSNVYVVDSGTVLVFAAVGASTGIIDVAPVTTVGMVGNSVALAIDTSAEVSAGTTQPIYIGDDGAAIGRSDTVSVYPAAPTGSASGTPSAIINGEFVGTNNGMSEPVGIALSNFGSIYVTNRLVQFNGSGSGSSSRSVQIYQAGSGATGAPGTISGGIFFSNSVTGIALDSSQNIYVLSNKGSEVDIFPAFCGGGGFCSVPLGILRGDRTLISNAGGIALDASDNIYLTNDATDILGDRVTVYPAGSTGNQPPSAVIVGTNTGLAFPAGMAIDPSGNIYVANKATDAVTVYPSGLTGTVNATPMATISGSNTLLNTPSAVALDNNNLIYVTNEGGYEGGNVGVTVYAAGASGNATPVTTIGGAATQLARPTGIVTFHPSPR